MKTDTYADWATAGWDAWCLGLDASAVIGLRCAKIAMGGEAAGVEAQLMLTEKVQAAMEMQTDLMFGGLGASPLAGTQKVLRHYGRKVSANRRRLS